MTETVTKRYRCDTPLEVVVKAGRTVLSKEIVTLEMLDAHLTIQSILYGGAYGQANWQDGKGNRLTHAPKATYRVLAESFELKDDEPCTCPKHKED